MGVWGARRRDGRTVLEYDPATLVWGLYVRESDADDETQVQGQLDELRPFALSVGGRTGREYVENDTSAFKRVKVRLPDGTYGFRVVRPKWDDMLSRFRRGELNALAVTNIDRGMRDPRDLEDLIDLVEHHGVLVKALSGSVDLTTDAGIGQARNEVNQRNIESRNISRRISRGNRRAALAGKNHGGGSRAFGWRKDQVNLNKREARFIQDAVERIAQGVALSTIAREWNAKGVKTVRGGPWSATTLRQILTNPRLCGRRTYYGDVLLNADGEAIRGEWEPIITDAEFEALVRLVQGGDALEYRRGRRSASPVGRPPSYLLTGVVRCGRCMGRMYGSTRKNRNGTKVRIYKCPSPGGGGCGRCVRSAELVEKYVTKLVLADQARTSLEREEAVEDDAPWAGESELAEVMKQVADTTARYRARRLEGSIFFPLIEDLQREQAELMKAKRQFEAQRITQRTPVDVRAEWPKLTIEQRRAAVAESVVAVIIHPMNGRRTWDPSLIEPVWRDNPTPQRAEAPSEHAV